MTMLLSETDYDRLAETFSRIYAETHSTPIARETSTQSARGKSPSRHRQIWRSGSWPSRHPFFYVVPPARLLRLGRHRDICAAR